MILKIKNFALYFLKIFFLFLIFYNGISTFVNFGLDLNISPSFLAIFRDGLWFLFVIIIFFLNFKKGVSFLKKNFYISFLVILFVLFGFILSYFYHSQTIYEIIVGFKSTLLPFFLFLSSIICGVLIYSENNKFKFDKIIRLFFRIILIGGFIWQILKIFFPDLFFSIGYGPIGDWHFNQNPPIYYRTGPGGLTRFSGLFSGPNNYGYFLILFFPYILNLFFKKEQKTSKKDFFLIILFILSGILTLSRGVILGRGIQFLLFLPMILDKYKYVLKKYKKIFFGLGILSVLFFFLLSYKKLGSTIEHFDKRTEGRKYIIQHPIFGYGWGTSGPAFHFGGKIIPENFYFQLRIDLGIFGLLVWILLRIFIFKKYYKYDKKKLFFGLFGLFFVGFFLHIWEDSMVNDLFFIIRGLYLGFEFSNQEL